MKNKTPCVVEVTRNSQITLTDTCCKPKSQFATIFSGIKEEGLVVLMKTEVKIWNISKIINFQSKTLPFISQTRKEQSN